MAPFVALTDEFASLLTKRKVRPLEGIREFISDRENVVRFDPIIIKALVKGFIRKD